MGPEVELIFGEAFEHGAGGGRLMGQFGVEGHCDGHRETKFSRAGGCDTVIFPMKIVLMGRMAAWCHAELDRRLHAKHEFTVIPDPRRLDEFAAELAAADVIAGWPLTQAILGRCHNLKLVQAAGAGIDGMDLALVPAGVQVANTFHHEIAIAEWVILAMLTLARRPAEHDARLRQGNWQGSCIWGETPVLRELYGQTLLLVGLGHIARETAIRARAFGMRIVGASRGGAVDWCDRTVPFAAWESELAEADWVAPTCPLTPETTGLIGASQIERMKRAAYLVNITRGRVLDETAVYQALRDGRIAGAALDVWYRYPADPDEVCFPSRLPFHELPNVLLSPHDSGWTLRTILGRVDDMADNINRLERGEPLRNVLK